MKKTGTLRKLGVLKRTPLKKVSDKKKQEDPQISKDRQDKDMEFYQKVWEKRGAKCEACGAPIFYSQVQPVNCDHLIAKSTHPELRYEEENLFICCLQCHSSKESGFPKPKHKEAMDRAKERFKIDKSGSN